MPNFRSWLPNELVDAAVERRVLLVEIGRGAKIAEGDGREIAEDEAGRGRAPRVVGIVERRPCQRSSVTGPSRCLRFGTRRAASGRTGWPDSPATPCRRTPRSSRLVSVSFRAEGRLDADDSGQETPDVTVGVVHLLGQLVLPGALIELDEHTSLGELASAHRTALPDRGAAG